jgi:hypothetical protein
MSRLPEDEFYDMMRGYLTGQEIKEHASAPPDPETLARYFHETYERLAPEFSYKTREASAVPWDDVPDNNKQLMIAVAERVIRRFMGW